MMAETVGEGGGGRIILRRILLAPPTHFATQGRHQTKRSRRRRCANHNQVDLHLRYECLPEAWLKESGAVWFCPPEARNATNGLCLFLAARHGTTGGARWTLTNSRPSSSESSRTRRGSSRTSTGTRGERLVSRLCVRLSMSVTANDKR